MSAVTGVIANFYEQQTLSYDERGKVYAPSARAVSFVQLFGSSLVLNPHLHLIFLDGVYGRGSDGMRFHPHQNYQLPDPDQMSMQGWCNVRYKWLSIHAGVAIKGEDRDGLKRLFRYASRSSVAVSQLTYVTPEDPDRSARHPDRREGSASHN